MAILLNQEIASIQNNYWIAIEEYNLVPNSLIVLFKALKKMGSSNIFMFFGITFGLAIFKVLFSLKQIQIFEPVISSIEIVLKKLVTFFIIYIIILFTFASIGTILFGGSTPIDGFQNLSESFITLIGYSFGGFSTSNYNYLKEKYNLYLQMIIFCFLFLFMFNIIFINLLIGMIGDIYSRTTENRKETYLLQIYQESQILSFCKKFSSFNTSYNLIIEATLPLYLGYFCFSTETINLFILAIHYSLIFLLNLSIVLAYNIILAPIAYIFGIFKYLFYWITIDQCNKNSLLFYLLYIILGLPFLFVSSFINLFQAAKLLLASNFNNKSYNYEKILPSKLSFRLFIKELKHFSDRIQRNELKNNIGNKINISNLASARKYGLLNISNLFSKIDLISFFQIIETCNLELDGFLYDNLLSIINYQKVYYNSWNCEKRMCQDPCREKWSINFTFLLPRIKLIFIGN